MKHRVYLILVALADADLHGLGIAREVQQLSDGRTRLWPASLYGTLDELFETATLRQTGKLRDFPLVLVGSEFWRPLVDFLTTLVKAGTIDAADLQRLRVLDSPEQVVAEIADVAMRRFGLTYGPRLRRRWYLGE